MIQTINEDAIRRIADLEEGVSVTAGTLDTAAFHRLVERQRAISNPTQMAFSGVFGLFLNRDRRERSLSLEQLGEEIDINTMEHFLIEEGKKIPEPRVVSKLARVLNVPAGPLMQLAGHVQTLNEGADSAASAFIARSNSKPVEPEERDALHEFMKALASS